MISATRLRISCMLVSLSISQLARGAIPSKEEIDKELAGPFFATAPHPDLSRAGVLCEQLKPLIVQQAKSQVNLTLPWKDDPSALYVQHSTKNDLAGIRRSACTAFGLAVISRYIDTGNGGDPNGISQADAKKTAIALLRYILSTHGAGEKNSLGGKPWKDQWQSAYWAAAAGRTAWLLWDDLDPEMKWLAADMITEEADRFVGREPDHKVEGDTKAEENAWNAEVIAIAYNMFPNHPHHASWGSTAIQWQISAYMTSADTQRTDIVDGKPVNQWFAFPNIYDDYTLENHDRVHPDYMTAVTLNIYQKLAYDFAGNPSPQSVLFNTDKVYASLKWLTFPDVGWVYASGQDWPIHRNADWINLHVAMAVLFNDPQAALLARMDIATAKKMIARGPQFGVYQPGETSFDSAQSQMLESAAQSFLLMSMHGEGSAPVEEAQLWKDLTGTHLFPHGRFAVLRTEHSVSTFSWGSQVMGMILPLQEDLLCTPYTNGMIGDFVIPGRTPEHAVAEKVQVMDITGHVAVAGILKRVGGAAEQRFVFCALPDGRTIYIDNAHVTGKTVRSVELGAIGILNDKNWIYHNGQRTLAYEGGQTIFKAENESADKPLELSSPWYNVDGLGIVVLGSSGHQIYQPKSKAPARSNRLEQMLYLNHPAAPDDLKPTVLVFYPGQSVAQTQAVASKLKIESRDSQHFSITLEDGRQITADLEQLKVSVQ